MVVQIEELTPEPIIIFTGEEPLTSGDPLDVLNAVSRFKQKINRHVYRIIDLSKVVIKFEDLINGMVKDKGDGGIDDPNVTTLYVGTDELVKYGVELFKRQGELFKDTHTILHFSTREEALAYARSEIEATQASE